MVLSLLVGVVAPFVGSTGFVCIGGGGTRSIEGGLMCRQYGWVV